MLLWDAFFVALAGLHGAVILAAPSIPLIAIGIWWNANTISHNFIHRPFFRNKALRTLFSAYLSVLLGVPQALWRQRHLAHHASVEWRFHPTTQVLVETVLIFVLWMTLAFTSLHFLLLTYLPAYGIGLALCGLQGYYEHALDATSHYGRLYNVLCFNDGYHAEHHAYPGLHWTALPGCMISAAPNSNWPALLRWIDHLSLEGLERLAPRSKSLRFFVLDKHREAFRGILPNLPERAHIVVVGGGLFPRTALIIRDLLPNARITILDASVAHLEIARKVIADQIDYVHCCFDPKYPIHCDLLVIPLSFDGDRALIYREPPACAVLVHDWIWRRRGQSRVVSVALLKRVNLITR